MKKINIYLKHTYLMKRKGTKRPKRRCSVYFYVKPWRQLANIGYFRGYFRSLGKPNADATDQVRPFS